MSMSELKIQCPKCSNEIELTEQLAGPMLADLKASFNEELAKRKFCLLYTSDAADE